MDGSTTRKIQSPSARGFDGNPKEFLTALEGETFACRMVFLSIIFPVCDFPYLKVTTDDSVASNTDIMLWDLYSDSSSGVKCYTCSTPPVLFYLIMSCGLTGHETSAHLCLS